MSDLVRKDDVLRAI